MPGHIGTISRTAPTLGMTTKALRATLIAGGLLDAETGQPTRAAFVHDAAFMTERASRTGYYRAAVWKEDGILAALPDVAPTREGVLSSFRNKRRALQALTESLTALRNAGDAAIRKSIDALGLDCLTEGLLDLTAGARAKRLTTLVDPVLSSIDRPRLTTAAADAYDATVGAMRWLTTSERGGPKPVAPVTIHPDPKPSRDPATGKGIMSMRLSGQEAAMLMGGCAVSADDPDPVSSRLASDLLGTLARSIEPLTTTANANRAAARTTRTCGSLRVRHLLTSREGREAGSVVASAHALTLKDGRLLVELEPAAFAFFEPGSIDPTDHEGPEGLVEALNHLVTGGHGAPNEEGDES